LAPEKMWERKKKKSLKLEFQVNLPNKNLPFTEPNTSKAKKKIETL
jgi:hypothetical protein